jgi:hypothetical protein
VYGWDPCNLRVDNIVPDFHDLFLAKAQKLVFKGNKLNIFVAICFSELDGLVKVLAFFYELQSEQITGWFDSCGFDLVLGLLSSGRVVGSDRHSEGVFDVLDLCHIKSIFK